MKKIQGIHEHGYWLLSSKEHPQYFDEPLTAAISDLACGWGVKSVIDIGCGDGRYTKFLLDKGFDAEGYDGNPYTPEASGGVCGVLDFAIPQNLRHYDLVLCLEVGEHVPQERELVFFHNIVNSQPDYIILSWAVKGQKGFGHFNCRNNDYVIKRMRSFGYQWMVDESKALRATSSLRWFKKTLMVFKKNKK